MAAIDDVSRKAPQVMEGNPAQPFVWSPYNELVNGRKLIETLDTSSRPDMGPWKGNGVFQRGQDVQVGAYTQGVPAEWPPERNGPLGGVRAMFDAQRGEKLAPLPTPMPQSVRGRNGGEELMAPTDNSFLYGRVGGRGMRGAFAEGLKDPHRGYFNNDESNGT